MFRGRPSQGKARADGETKGDCKLARKAKADQAGENCRSRRRLQADGEGEADHARPKREPISQRCRRAARDSVLRNKPLRHRRLTGAGPNCLCRPVYRKQCRVVGASAQEMRAEMCRSLQAASQPRKVDGSLTTDFTRRIICRLAGKPQEDRSLHICSICNR